MITDPLFYRLAVIGGVLLGLSKGGFLGLGVMALPLMSLFVPPLQAAAIILPTALAQDVLTRLDLSARLERLEPEDHAARAWPPACSSPGCSRPRLSAAHIRLAIGLIAGAVRAAALARHALRALAPQPSVATGILFGAIGGFTTMLANAGGPAWQMHLLPQQLDKLTYVGTFTILFAASNVMKIPAFGALGYLTRENLAGRRASGADRRSSRTTPASGWCGGRPTEMFFRIAYVLMFVIAVELIRSALIELWRAERTPPPCAKRVAQRHCFSALTCLAARLHPA